MPTKKYVSLEKLGLYDEKIKKHISDADAAVLASAKEYAEGLADNYEAAGSVATAKSEIQGKIDAVQANVDIAKAAADNAQGEVDALETLVGTLPSGTTATSVVDYINIKTSGIATDAALGELNNQVSGLQTAVKGITDDYLKSADKTELADSIAAEASRADTAEKANAAAIKAITDDYLKGDDKVELQGNIDGVAEDVATIAGDYLKASDKAELQGNIDAKADQSSLDAEIERATQAEAGLQTQINTIMNNPDAEGAINSINEFVKYVEDHGTIADGFRTDIDKNKGDIADMDAAYKAADVALSGRLDVLEAIDHDAYIAADTALKTELNGEITKKADASALTSAVETINGDIADLQAADAGIIERVAAVEALMGDGDGSVADQIADVKAELQGELAQAIADAKTDASNKDAVVLAEAQKASTAVQTNLDTHTNNGDIHVTAEQKTAWTTAAGKAHEHSNLTVLEGITAAKITAWDAAEGNAKTHANNLNTAMDTRVVALETWHNNFTEVSEEEINNLFA